MQFSLLIGIISGFVIIIPFIGLSVAFLISLVSGYLTSTDNMYIIYVLCIYGVGHVLEAYILVPKIIGNKIELHPVWILFSMICSGSVLGFVGIILAIPIAGIAKVFIEAFVKIYKNSEIYKGVYNGSNDI